MKKLINKAFDHLLDLLFPPRCIVCGEVMPIGNDICGDCIEELSRELICRELCPVCGKPQKSCICRHTQLFFAKCVSAFVYQKRIEALIIRLKTQPDCTALSQTGELMERAFLSSALRNIKFDFITCVPMSVSKLSQSGHNHAETLALEMSRRLRLPYISPPFVQSEKYRSQHSLGRDERRDNVLRGYKRIEGAAVSGRALLIDDIMTTGATLNRCAQLLLQSGASEVFCLTAATTLLDFDNADGSTAEKLDF